MLQYDSFDGCYHEVETPEPDPDEQIERQADEKELEEYLDSLNPENAQGDPSVQNP